MTESKEEQSKNQFKIAVDKTLNTIIDENKYIKKETRKEIKKNYKSAKKKRKSELEKFKKANEARKKMREKTVLKVYNIRLHKAEMFVLMMIILGIIVFAIPWFVFGIREVYQKSFDSSVVSSIFSGDATDYLGMLPDFLGGVLGIIIGFFVEKHLFEKWRNLSRYKELKNVIRRELVNIEDICGKNYEICENKYSSTAIDKLLSGVNTRELLTGFKTVTFGDIICSAEYDSLLFNLPTYFPLWIPHINEKKGHISMALHDINGSIEAAIKCINDVNEIIIDDIDNLRIKIDGKEKTVVTETQDRLIELAAYIKFYYFIM